MASKRGAKVLLEIGPKREKMSVYFPGSLGRELIKMILDDGTKQDGFFDKEKLVPGKFRGIFWSNPIAVNADFPEAGSNDHFNLGRPGNTNDPETTIVILLQSQDSKIKWQVKTSRFELSKTLPDLLAYKELAEQFYQRVTLFTSDSPESKLSWVTIDNHGFPNPFLK